VSPSAIEWTEETWNPTVGCSRVSAGCDRCYAIGVAHRAMQPAHVGLTEKTDRGIDWTGEVRLLPERLEVPLRRAQPTTYFVDSMSDLFHPAVPSEFIAEVFAVMSLATQHTFQVLTKRPQRMAQLLAGTAFRALVGTARQRRNPHRLAPDFAPRNIWLGTSIEEDRWAFRADAVRDTPAAVRFLSLEPLLGPLPSLDLTGVDWVIVGGESGPGARPMHPEWVRDIRNRCYAASIPFFFKQWGTWGPLAPLDEQGRYDWSKGHALANDGTLYEPGALDYPNGPRRGEAIRAGHDRARLTSMYRLGKHAAGRELDGETWDEMPERVSA